jgi:DNA-binding transcriptional regulator LsrR (DeoR family)
MTSRATSDGQLRMIAKVARMYHERGIRQVDIAETLHISQPRVSRLLKRAHELGIVRTIVVVSQGMRRSGNAVDESEQAKLLASGAVGDVCHRFFDHGGNAVPSDLDHRVLGIDSTTLRAIPRRVGLAGGPAKHDAIRAAVVGGWVNVLLTDITTARTLLA